MKIKTPRIEDSEEISTLLQETFQNVNSKDYSPKHIEAWIKFDTPERIQKVIQDKSLRNFLAIENDEIVGFLSLAVNESLLNSLYVKSSKTGLGIGSELLEIAELILKNQGKKAINLNSSKTAEKFYNKKGYKRKGPINLTIEGTKIPAIQMRKNLST